MAKYIQTSNIVSTQYEFESLESAKLDAERVADINIRWNECVRW